MTSNYIKQIESYIPINEQEKIDKESILKFISLNEDVLLRENKIAHMTSSGFILNKQRTKVLMIHHNIYNTWAWTGGHADGDTDLLQVAIKEAVEETGISSVEPIINEIASIEVLTVNAHIKRGEFVAPHLHLSVSYILQANEDEELSIKEDENSGVMWIDIDKLDKYSNEPYMIYIYQKLIDKAKKYI